MSSRNSFIRNFQSAIDELENEIKQLPEQLASDEIVEYVQLIDLTVVGKDINNEFKSLIFAVMMSRIVRNRQNKDNTILLKYIETKLNEARATTNHGLQSCAIIHYVRYLADFKINRDTNNVSEVVQLSINLSRQLIALEDVPAIHKADGVLKLAGVFMHSQLKAGGGFQRGIELLNLFINIPELDQDIPKAILHYSAVLKLIANFQDEHCKSIKFKVNLKLAELYSKKKDDPKSLDKAIECGQAAIDLSSTEDQKTISNKFCIGLLQKEQHLIRRCSRSVRQLFNLVIPSQRVNSTQNNGDSLSENLLVIDDRTLKGTLKTLLFEKTNEVKWEVYRSESEQLYATLLCNSQKNIEQLQYYLQNCNIEVDFFQRNQEYILVIKNFLQNLQAAVPMLQHAEKPNKSL